MFELVEEIQQGAKIKVVGVGGAGGNAINTMIVSSLDGVDFLAANTDLQALKANRAGTRIQLGRVSTKGLGAGANPEIGRNAAIETERELAEALAGADMIFVTAGMGGGTGTGAAPIVARVAKECGALTVGVVTKPFAFEGKRRARFADEGIGALRDAVDTLITIPNEKLLGIAGRETTVVDTFKMADEVLLQAVRGIANLITVHGLINLDFADVRSVMSEMGMALMGTGCGSGENRAVDAATKAISSPLLENVSIHGATGLLINITGGADMTLHEVNEASKLIQEEADEDANVIFGAVIDESLADQIQVTVIATGFSKAQRHVGRGTLRETSRERDVVREREPRDRDWSSAPVRDRESFREAPISVSERQPARAERPAARPAAQGRDWNQLWDGTEMQATSSDLGSVERNMPEGNLGLQQAMVEEEPVIRKRTPPPALPLHLQDDVQLQLQPVETRPVGATVRQPYMTDPEPVTRFNPMELREIMAEVGLGDQREDQYDIPTFLRKQAD